MRNNKIQSGGAAVRQDSNRLADRPRAGVAFMRFVRRYQAMRRTVKAKSLQDRGTVALARGLVGKVLARRHADGAVTRHRITEVEAYDGEKDLACHASKGRTKRTEVMYRPGGIWYVYLCYGV